MGTPTDPPEDGESCALCWGSSQSPFGEGLPPAILQVEVSNVHKGSAWLPIHGEDFNGIWPIPNLGSCLFDAGFGNQSFVIFGVGQSRILLTNTSGQVFFSTLIFEQCVGRFSNQLTNPSGIFVGGTAELLL